MFYDNVSIFHTDLHYVLQILVGVDKNSKLIFSDSFIKTVLRCSFSLKALNAFPPRRSE